MFTNEETEAQFPRWWQSGYLAPQPYSTVPACLGAHLHTLYSWALQRDFISEQSQKALRTKDSEAGQVILLS